MRHFSLFVSVLVLALGVYYSFSQFFHDHSPKTLPIHRENQPMETQWMALAKAEKALNEGDLVQVSHLLSRYPLPLDDHTEENRRWLNLALSYHEQVGHAPLLLDLYAKFPHSFVHHEKASLIVGDALLLDTNKSAYKALRQAWYGKENHQHGWFILDVDYLLQQGNKQEALELLHMNTFAGKADTGRLTRLALLYITENPKKAWGYLNEAYVKDPLNPQVRAYRAKLLEAAGKDQLALNEYEAAAQINPANPYFQDQLADYHVRHQNFSQANAIWKKQLAQPLADSFWVKAIFWNKVTTPSKDPWDRSHITMGKYYDLVEYYLQLRPHQFWDQAAFEKIPSSSVYLNHQTTKWLRLVHLLQHHLEQEALALLEDNTPEDFSWSPHLYHGLKNILSYRTKQALHDNTDFLSENDQGHPFFQELLRFEKAPEKATPQFRSLLLSPDIFSIAFLAEGWYEAALQLPHAPSLSKSYPEWIPFAYTQAMQTNRSAKEALSYAQAQLSSSPLSLLMAKLYMQEHEPDQAVAILKTISRDQDKHGVQAALLLGQIFLKHQAYDQAQSAIWNNDHARQTLNGREILARIALLEGDATKAIALYTEIAKESSEAQSFLAQKAFQNEDWHQAKELTERLLKKSPDNTLLQQNLRKILGKLPREE